MGKSRPVVIVFSILAGMQVLTNAAGLSEVLGAKVFFLMGIFVAAVQVGMTFYVQNVTVPTQDVAAFRNEKDVIVAGPAAGATDGTPVSVEPGTLDSSVSTEWDSPPGFNEGSLGDH